MKQLNFQMIDKKLAKKNAELQELRETRQKLADKEKEICASIDKLQNQKIEVIFEQVKKEIKNENLNVSSASLFLCLMFCEVSIKLLMMKKLKNHQINRPKFFQKKIKKLEIVPVALILFLMLFKNNVSRRFYGQ